MTSHEPLYPVVLVVAGKSCLVVGGGHVAARKTRSLLACGASVTMIAPEAHEALAILSADGTIAAIRGAPLEVKLRPYESGEAAEYQLVVTATGIPEVDRAVAHDADRAGVWVNSSDDPANCTFLLPAVHRLGNITVSVSTSGSSPALATWLRGRIADMLDPALEDLSALLEEARHIVHARGDSTESIDWSRLLDGPLPGLVTEGRMDDARRVIRDALSDEQEEGSHS